MDIEEVAEKTPEQILKEFVDPGVGLQPFQARKLAFALGLEGPQVGAGRQADARRSTTPSSPPTRRSSRSTR